MCFFIGKKHDIQRYMLRFPVQAENNAENRTFSDKCWLDKLGI